MSEPKDRSSGSGWRSETFRWVLVTLLIPFAGFVWNEVQKRELQRQEQLERVRAEQQARIANARGESDIVIRLLPSLTAKDDTPARGIALAILVNLASREAFSAELAGAIQVAVDTSQERVREGTATPAELSALGRVAAATDRSADRPVDRVEPAAGPREFVLQVPRVYIHIFDQSDAAGAKALADWIAGDRRWLAPGIENVVATAARRNTPVPRGGASTDVRYFNDEDQPRADQIAQWLRGRGENTTVTRVRLSAPPGQMEVWFPQHS